MIMMVIKVVVRWLVMMMKVWIKACVETLLLLMIMRRRKKRIMVMMMIIMLLYSVRVGVIS